MAAGKAERLGVAAVEQVEHAAIRGEVAGNDPVDDDEQVGGVCRTVACGQQDRLGGGVFAIDRVRQEGCRIIGP